MIADGMPDSTTQPMTGQAAIVYLFDGTTVSMPDTPENQAAYPQVYNQKRGLGFPIARVGALTSLACGANLKLGVCRYAGQGQGEVSLLRQLWDVLRPGDVLLASAIGFESDRSARVHPLGLMKSTSARSIHPLRRSTRNAPPAFLGSKRTGERGPNSTRSYSVQVLPKSGE